MDTVDKGVLFAKENGYSIYQLYNSEAMIYYLCIPDNYADIYELFLSFPKRDLSSLSKEEVIIEVKDISDLLGHINKHSIYVLPDIPLQEVTEAAHENDDKLYRELLKHIQATLSGAYKVITSSKEDKEKVNVNQVISVIKQTEDDKKFINWLEINIPNFIHGITLEEIKKKYNQNNSDISQEVKITLPSNDSESNASGGRNMNGSNIPTNNNSMTKKLVPPKKNTSHGFSNITFSFLILSIAVIIGIALAYMIIK